MSIFAVNMRHVPESCPMFNSTVRERTKKIVMNGGDVAKKHKIKIVSGVVSMLDHRIYFVIESESQSNVEEYLREIDYASWNIITIKQVRPIEEVLKQL